MSTFAAHILTENGGIRIEVFVCITQENAYWQAHSTMTRNERLLGVFRRDPCG